MFRDLAEEYRQHGWGEDPQGEDWALSPEEESSTRLRRLAVRAVTEGVMTSEEAAAVLDVDEQELDLLISAPMPVARTAIRAG